MNLRPWHTLGVAVLAVIMTVGCSAWESVSEPTQAGACDPSYPEVCIPSPAPDLDCGDIEYRRFEVLAPDPHGFDGDKDGVGCES
jgi:micrococcal nuclease